MEIAKYGFVWTILDHYADTVSNADKSPLKSRDDDGL